MRSGQLRHRVYLQQPSYTYDTYGEATASWVTYATVNAAIMQQTSFSQNKEKLEAKQIAGTTNTKIIIRYLKNVSISHRVVLGDHTYEINDIINPEMRNRELQLVCSEVTD